MDSVCSFAANITNTQVCLGSVMAMAISDYCIDSTHLCNVCALIAGNCQCPGLVDTAEM